MVSNDHPAILEQSLENAIGLLRTYVGQRLMTGQMCAFVGEKDVPVSEYYF